MEQQATLSLALTYGARRAWQPPGWPSICAGRDIETALRSAHDELFELLLYL